MLPSTSSSASTMQGTLWKWTNYLSGWQPRWFVLESGCLTYYISPNEMHLGSRGSLKVSSCDITVHPSDHQRMDMTMPGGRHIYLRAASMAERQQWLLVLGVAKQGGLDIASNESANARNVTIQKKMNELQNNCQLLVSQINSIQTMTSDLATADPKVLADLSSKISVMCDKFLNALQECIDLSPTQQVSPSLKPLPLKELYPLQKGGDGISPVGKLSRFSDSEHSPSLSASLPLNSKLKKSTPTPDEATADAMTQSLPTHLLGARQSVQESSDGQLGTKESAQESSHGQLGTKVSVQESSDGQLLNDRTSSSTSKSESMQSHSNSDSFITPTSSPVNTPPLSPPPPSLKIKDRISVKSDRSARTHKTFFSSLPFQFQDLELEELDQIPSEPFLQCCQTVLPFFDKLSATAFAPVKTDISGNITKLRKKLSDDPVKYRTLQAMVNSEIHAGTCNASNSATDALLWLKRAMEFVQHFIAEVAAGEQSLDVAAGKAYTLSLRKYHGWIIRGVFNLAMKAVPYHKDFLHLLGSLGTGDGESQVIEDMAVFASSLQEIITILNRFYHENNLEMSPE